jgi:hypothetical protein
MSRRWFSVIAIGVCLLASSASSQKSMEEPISKDGLFKALERRLSKTGLEHLIERVQEWKVSFHLDDVDEQKIRRLQKHLGKTELENLISAIRRNYEIPWTLQHPQELAVFGSTRIRTDIPIPENPCRSIKTVDEKDQRTLTKQEEIDFVEILKGNQKGTIFVNYVETFGPEPCRFARQLAVLLQSEAGWTVGFGPVFFGAGGPSKPTPDMYISVQDADNPPPRAVALQLALKTVGYTTERRTQSKAPADFVQLVVWFKAPPPPQ